VHQLVRDSEENCVTGTNIRHFAQDLRRSTLAQLKEAPVVSLRAEIDAHANQSMVDGIGVPRIVMAGTGHHSVDPAQEATDVAAAGELLHERKQPLVVSEKVQEIERRVVLQAQLDADVIVSPLGELGNLEAMVNETQERRSEESFEANAVLPIELRPETCEIRARGHCRPRSGEMNHAGPAGRGYQIRVRSGPVEDVACRSDTVRQSYFGGVMALTLSDSIVVSEDVLFRALDDEAVLLDLKTGVYFGLNPLGARIWQLIVEKHSLARVLEVVLHEYDVEPSVVETDLLDLGLRLCASGLGEIRAEQPVTTSETRC
jgi:hypothetical protein